MYNNLSFIKPKPGIQLNRAHPQAQGLVGYWPLNEGSGSKTYDVSGNGNHGTLTNFALSGSTSNWVGSSMGGGLRFDGVDDHVTCTDSSVLNSPAITYVAWINPSAFSDDYAGLILKRSAPISIYPHGIFIRTTGKLSMYALASATVNYDGTGAHTLVVGKDYMIALTYSSSQGLIGYVNGVIDNTVAANGNAQSLAESVYIGNDYAAANRFYTGTMNEVRMYNRALTQSEIQTLYVNPHIDFHGSKTRLLAGAI